MYCHNCGKQIFDGMNFCRYCGASQAIINGGASDGIPASQNSAQPDGIPASQNRIQPDGIPASQNSVQPDAQPPESQYSYAAPQPPVTPPSQNEPEIHSQPVPQPVPQPQPVPAAPSSVMLASQPCSYKVAMESDFKKFEFGGMPEGTVEIYDDRLEFFQKSKMVKLAFGMIGSVLSGKGKADIIISGHMVRRDTVTNQKNVFRFYLTDGQLAYVQLNGLGGQQDARNAMLRFLKV